MKIRIPADETERRNRGLLLLLGVVVAGSSWQIASRTGLAEPARTVRREQAPVIGRAVAPRPSSNQVDFASRLGLAKPGTPSRRAANAWMQKPARPVRAPIATASIGPTATRRAAEPSTVVEPAPAARHESDPRPPIVHQDSSRQHAAFTVGTQRASVPSSRPGWSIPELTDEPDAELLDEDDLEAEDDEEVDETEPVSESLAKSSTDQGRSPADGAQMVVLGPAVTSKGEIAIYSISVENAVDVAHAPIRLVYDPEVLELVSVEEGSFFSSDGTATRFLARAGSAAGVLDISISRLAPARGIDGGGVLCTVTFLARAEGSSPVVLAGSRLLDSDGGKLDFGRNDAEVAVK